MLRYRSVIIFRFSMKNGNSSVETNPTLPIRTADKASYYANTSTPSMRRLPLVARGAITDASCEFVFNQFFTFRSFPKEDRAFIGLGR